jgi:hypothetical protein
MDGCPGKGSRNGSSVAVAVVALASPDLAAPTGHHLCYAGPPTRILARDVGSQL